ERRADGGPDGRGAGHAGGRRARRAAAPPRGPARMSDVPDAADMLGLAWAPTVPALPSPSLTAALPMQYARRHLVLPIGPADGVLTVAVADPTALAPLDDLRFLFERPVVPLVVPAAALRTAIARAYDEAARREPAAAAALEAELGRPLELDGDGLEALADAP